MVNTLFALRRDQFKACPCIPTGLDLIYEKDHYAHIIALDDPCEPEEMLSMILSMKDLIYLSFFV
jgi:hypothetical protein